MAMAAYAAAITFLALESYEKNVANKFEKTPQICGQKIVGLNTMPLYRVGFALALQTIYAGLLRGGPTLAPRRFRPV